MQLPLGQSPARVLDAQDGSHRRSLACRDLEPLDRLQRARRRRQRRAQARPPVAVAQTANLEFRSGREFSQPEVAPDQAVLIERHIEAAEGQLVDARTQLDLRAAHRLEGLGEGAIVELDRPAVTRVERAWRLTPVIREQVGEGVHRRSQIVWPAAAFGGVLEGELGVSEHRVRPGNPGFDGIVQRRQGGCGIVLRNVGNTGDPQHVLGEVAELAAREHVAGQLAMHALRVGSLDPDRGRAAGGEQQSQQAEERPETPVHQDGATLALDDSADAHSNRLRPKLRSSSSGSWVVPTAITGTSTAIASGRTPFLRPRQGAHHGAGAQVSPDYLSGCAAQALSVRRPKLSSEKRSPCGISFAPCVAIHFGRLPVTKHTPGRSRPVAGWASRDRRQSGCRRYRP